ncbi:protease secretion system outer membrane protein [Pseudoduganella lurida]|uniref:Protease secretion system outer membrane protein n=1 Tax=Pseudoduganella lurida TaxID=1036180 RepID=A0A562R5J0_9BURK|nr:TolC family outer membrane protein [Pseudoduganella lurida]TWI64339.1 protease secretion system outer membrane protein [Pseudoduganella lurida]
MKFTNTRLRGALAAALLAGFGAASAPASALGLMQAYQAALANDPTFREAVQDAAAGRENRIIGRANLLPNVSANYGANKNFADLVVTTQQGQRVPSEPEYISRTASVQLRQPLFNLDALARYKQGNAQANYSEEQFRLRGHELILRVVSAYVDALFAREQVRLSKVQRDMYAEQRAVNDRLFTGGEGTKTDMLETQARLDLSEAQLLEAQDNEQAALATLSGVVGQPVEGLDELAERFRIAPLPEGGYEQWRKLAFDNNPDLVSQTFAIEAAQQEVNRSKAGHYPRVDMVASVSKNTAETLNTYNQESKNRAIGIQVNVPIYAGGQISAVSRQSVAGLEKARAEYQVKTDKITVELKKQYAAVTSSTARIQALDKAVISAKLLVTATTQSIRGGVRINLDLLNAQQTLFTSERDLAQARYNYLLAKLRLRAAAGTLGDEDVRDMASYFR